MTTFTKPIKYNEVATLVMVIDDVIYVGRVKAVVQVIILDYKYNVFTIHMN